MTVGACLKPSNFSAVGASLKPSNLATVGAAETVGAASIVGARSMVGTGRNSELKSATSRSSHAARSAAAVATARARVILIFVSRSKTICVAQESDQWLMGVPARFVATEPYPYVVGVGADNGDYLRETFQEINHL